jgi:hypothetical protein
MKASYNKQKREIIMLKKLLKILLVISCVTSAFEQNSQAVASNNADDDRVDRLLRGMIHVLDQPWDQFCQTRANPELLRSEMERGAYVEPRPTVINPYDGVNDTSTRFVRNLMAERANLTDEEKIAIARAVLEGRRDESRHIQQNANARAAQSGTIDTRTQYDGVNDTMANNPYDSGRIRVRTSGSQVFHSGWTDDIYLVSAPMDHSGDGRLFLGRKYQVEDTPEFMINPTVSTGQALTWCRQHDDGTHAWNFLYESRNAQRVQKLYTEMFSLSAIEKILKGERPITIG